MNRFQTIYASQETGRWGVFDHQYDLGINGLIFVQDIPATIWTFQHNLNKLPFFLQIYRYENDGTRTEIKPLSNLIDFNSMTVNFEIPITGTIVVVFANPTE